MGRFAPVAPIRILDRLAERRHLGPYHLLLAHDIIENVAAYDEVFNKSHTGFLNIILDNSVIELGNAVDLDIIVKAAKAVNPTVLVLPDVLLDGKKTYDSIREAMPLWIKTFDSAKLKRDHSFMLVPQGRTVKEFTECASNLSWLAHIYRNEASFWWGIPRNFRDTVGVSRQIAVDICNMLQPTWYMHMLGFSDDLVDDFLVCRQNSHVMGIDSAAPLRAASLEKKFTLYHDYGPRGDWWETATFTEGMIDNIRIARSFAGK